MAMPDVTLQAVDDHVSCICCGICVFQLNIASTAGVQVVLTAQGAKQGLGAVGQITKVPNGYFRNFLQPQRLALPATQGVLE